MAFVGGPPSHDAAARGLRGYRAAVSRLKRRGSDAVAEVESTEAGGFAGASSLLARKPRPSAFVVASFTQSVGAMAAIRRADLAIPGDVSVVALHDAPLAAYLDPPLTAVRMPLREVAETAVDQLIRAISGEDVGDVVVPTPPELVVRGTTAGPASDAQLLSRRPARPHRNGGLRGPVAVRRPFLGLVVNLRYAENTEVVAATRQYGAAADCTILVADANEFVGREENYARLVRERRVDGLLMGTLMPTADDLATLARQRLPLVLVGRRIPSVAPGVAADDEAGLRIAVDHLVRLGHRRIAYITGPGDADTVHRRLEGFRSAVLQAGLELRPDYVVTSSADPEAGPARAMAQLLRLDTRPTAVILWTVGDAAGALHAAHAESLSVPGDLSVVAINDSPLAAFLSPPLTVVRMPMAELAGKAVARLCDVVARRAVTGDLIVRTPPLLVERHSTRPPQNI
jgi:LacI family transcriptional regulator, galactose operon repressor